MRYLVLVFLVGCVHAKASWDPPSSRPEPAVVEPPSAATGLPPSEPPPGGPAPELAVTVDERPKVDCDAKFADEMAAARVRHEERLEAKRQKIAKGCTETTSRHLVLNGDGKKVGGGPPRLAWICNGMPMDQKPEVHDYDDQSVEEVKRKIRECRAR